MEEVIKLLKLIQNTSSLNEKQRILKENKDNELLKKCLVFLLDGNIVTGISTKKIDKMTVSKAERYAILTSRKINSQSGLKHHFQQDYSHSSSSSSQSSHDGYC